jgi:hypothetical protein
MSVHELKIKSQWFARVKSGEKRAEVRKHDRDFQVGDTLRLIEVSAEGRVKRTYVPQGRDERDRFTPERWVKNSLDARITHVLPGMQVDGMAGDYCVLSIVLTNDGGDSDE